MLLSPFPWLSVSSLTLRAGTWLMGTAHCGAGGRTQGAALGAGSASTGVSTMEPEERALEAEESRRRELGQQRGLRGREVSRGRWGSSPRRRGSCVSTETAGMGFQKESTGRGRRVVSGHPAFTLDRVRPGGWALGGCGVRTRAIGQRGLPPSASRAVMLPRRITRGLDRGRGWRSTGDCSMRSGQRQTRRPGRERGRGWSAAATTVHFSPAVCCFPG